MKPFHAYPVITQGDLIMSRTPFWGHTRRCVDGRVMRHDPQPDDPSLETDIGECEACEGEGCDGSEDGIHE